MSKNEMQDISDYLKSILKIINCNLMDALPRYSRSC